MPVKRLALLCCLVLALTVGAAAIAADFSATPTSGQAPFPVQFTDASTGSPTAWTWDFGDGATSTEQNPSHDYYEAGSHDVTLTVDGPSGSESCTKYNYIVVDFMLTRAQMCYLLACAIAGGDANIPAGPYYGFFSDVPADYWACKYIEFCHQAGLITGFADGTFQPELLVDRGQMAVYFARTVAGGDANVPDGPVTPTFADVPTDFWAYKYVEYLNSHVSNAAYGPDPSCFHPYDLMPALLAASWLQQGTGIAVSPRSGPRRDAGGFGSGGCVFGQPHLRSGASDGRLH